MTHQSAAVAPDWRHNWLAGLSEDARRHALDGLGRLNDIVPLAARQAALPPGWRRLHRVVLRSLAGHGVAPTRDALAAASGGDPEAALQRLFADDLLVAAADGKGIAGAYPFTLESTDHQVGIGPVTVNAMCAVDALSVSPMLGRPTRIHSRCRVSGAPVALDQDAAQVTAIPGLCVGIHWQGPAAGTCTAHSLCREMVFLLGDAAVEAWRGQAPRQRLIYSTAEAIALGACFFVPLLAGD